MAVLFFIMVKSPKQLLTASGNKGIKMKTGMEYFLDDVRKLTKTRPPYNEAFISRALNVLNTAVTIIEGLNIVIAKDNAQIVTLKADLERIKNAANEPKIHRQKLEMAPRNVELLKDAASGKMTQTAIAKKYGITPARVYFLIKKAKFNAARTA